MSCSSAERLDFQLPGHATARWYAPTRAQAGVRSARVNEECVTELPDVPQTLEPGVSMMAMPRLEADVVPGGSELLQTTSNCSKFFWKSARSRLAVRRRPSCTFMWTADRGARPLRQGCAAAIPTRHRFRSVATCPSPRAPRESSPACLQVHAMALCRTARRSTRYSRASTARCGRAMRSPILRRRGRQRRNARRNTPTTSPSAQSLRRSSRATHSASCRTGSGNRSAASALATRRHHRPSACT